MKVNVTYDSFNTVIESATVLSTGDVKYEFKTIPIDDVNLEKKLEIKAVDALNPDGIPVQMNHGEAKQFLLLMNQFMVQLQVK